jgi:mono/diheme cytochrome c family protein
MSACVAASGESRGTVDSPGALLYSTYCVSCHTAQVHWREKKLATDWTSLKLQVRRWQGNAALGLSEDDIAAIAGYLNDLYYHFAATDTKQSGEAGSAPSRSAAPGLMVACAFLGGRPDCP